MKFTDLTPAQRSMLAALCATSGVGLQTDRLGMCVSPRQFCPSDAASSLLGMRKLGLVYSNQKTANQVYAIWKASEYGLAVFMGRPADVPVLNAGQTSSSQVGHTTPQRKTIIFCPGLAIDFTARTRKGAIEEAQRLATANPGRIYGVYEQVAEASMPVPQAQVTLL